MSVVKIAVNGALGRMGTRILAIAQEEPAKFKIAQAFEADGNTGKLAGGVKTESLLPYAKGEKKLECDVLIDFSGPEGARQCVAAANLSTKALVVGSTGLDGELVKEISATATKVPVVYSSNMSVGVNVVLELLTLAVRKLPKNFNIRMTEAHHIHKKDAPSGTALTMRDAIQRQAQSQKKINIESIREGEIVGDHSVFFEGPAETIEIRHHADSRDTFARGALQAALFLANAKAGRLYSMADVLNA